MIITTWANVIKNTAEEIQTLEIRRNIPILGDTVSFLLNLCCGVVNEKQLNSFISNEKTLTLALNSFKQIEDLDKSQFTNLTRLIETRTGDYARKINELHAQITNLMQISETSPSTGRGKSTS